MTREDLVGKKILILGFGREGRDTLKFLRQNFPQEVLGIADQLGEEKLEKEIQEEIKKDNNLKLYFGSDYLQAISEYEVIFKSPGIPLSKVAPFLKKGQCLTSQTEFFLENCPGMIIGVTGTKGKGTTASLLEQILKEGGKEVFLIGNIGEPVLSYLASAKKEEIFIYELSAQQLQNLKISPPVAIFLNLYQAHLDHFQNFQEYQEAKETIALFQKKDNHFIYNADQKELRRLAKKDKAIKIAISLEKEADSYLKDNWLYWRKEKIIEVKEIPLVGRFNFYNVIAAIASAKLLEVSTENIRKGIKEFRTLPHRLEFIGKFKGIDFYNDSLATLPEPAMFAIEALDKRLETILLGGHEAGQNFKGLAKKILESEIKNVILFLPTGARIREEIEKIVQEEKKEERGKEINYFFVENMEEAIKIVFSKTSQEKVCLLSPASPSFGVFKDYKERGELFKKYIEIYG